MNRAAIRAMDTTQRNYRLETAPAQRGNVDKLANVYGLVLDSETGLWDWYHSEDERSQRPHIDDLHPRRAVEITQ